MGDLDPFSGWRFWAWLPLMKRYQQAHLIATARRQDLESRKAGPRSFQTLPVTVLNFLEAPLPGRCSAAYFPFGQANPRVRSYGGTGVSDEIVLTVTSLPRASHRFLGVTLRAR